MPYAPTPELDYQPVDEADLRMIEEGALPSGKQQEVDQLINELMMEDEEQEY